MNQVDTGSPSPWHIVQADTAEQIAVARELFLEYARSTSADVCFQQFDGEVATLPGRYAPPRGRLLLAFQQDLAAGCVALRELGDGICEMKRLYVRPAFRGQGGGGRLARRIIEEASEVGYQRMRLDTLASMERAIVLYQSLGFVAIAPYCHNPDPSALFFELRLGAAS